MNSEGSVTHKRKRPAPGFPVEFNNFACAAKPLSGKNFYAKLRMLEAALVCPLVSSLSSMPLHFHPFA
jgi:hypothetical protein